MSTETGVVGGHAGIDVGSKELVVAVGNGSSGVRIRRFGNASSAHRALIEWLRVSGVTRVCVEASGIYSLDLCLALDSTEGMEVMVANPRAVKAFGNALLARNKTDPEDAAVLLAFAERMPFDRWTRPSETALTMRTLVRRTHALSRALRCEKCQLHAAKQTSTTPKAVLDDLEEGVRSLEHRIARLQREAAALARTDPKLRRQLELLVTVRGIAERSALQVLAELCVLPADMTAKQWVAHAGLDPRKVQSGTSLDKPTRISKRGNRYLRLALYMPALTAASRDEHAKALHRELVDRGKKPMQANVVVMRKLLHAIHAMLRTDQPYDSRRAFRGGSGGAEASNAAAV